MDFVHLFQLIKLDYFVSINVGEYRRGNQKRKIQRKWQKTQDQDFVHLFQLIKLDYFVSINVGEYRRGNQKRKIQRKWQKTQDQENTTLYVLDTTMRKQTQTRK